MKKEYDFWEQFKRTGRVLDYLNYTACAKEESKEWSCVNNDDDREQTGSDGDGDGTVLGTGRRI